MDCIDSNELLTVMALAGNKRLPHLEAEIFANDETTRVYVIALCNAHYRSHVGSTQTRLVYRYAREVLRFSWPSAEKLLATNPEYIYYYLRIFMTTKT